MINPRDAEHKDYETAARKIWGHDPPAPASAAIIPAVTIIADAANAPTQNSDSHGSASAVDNSIPTTSAAPSVGKDGKVAQAAPPAKPGAAPVAVVAAGKAPAARDDDGEEDTPQEAYRKAWEE
jgi:hypothetical protein